LNSLAQNLYYATRILIKKPVFTSVVILSLAVGIGLNTAIFTLIDKILLGSLPYPNPNRLISISSIPPSHPDQFQGASIPDLFAWRRQAHSFEAVGALVNSAVDLGAEENGQPAERVQGEFVTPSLLQALGVQPLMGRLFNEDEDTVGHPAPVIIISYRLWQRRFGGDKDILNRKILVGGQATSIVGVMPSDFRFSDEQGDYLAPFPLNQFQLRSSARFVTAAGRLKPGVTMQQAQSEMDAISVQLARDNPAHDAEHGTPWRVRLQPIREALFGFITRPLMLLQGAVAFVLLIACANVAALLIARAPSRQSEVAIRAALGAGRGRIFRQFLTESLLLAAAGGLLGIALAWGIVHVLVSMAPPWLPRLHAMTLDTRVLLFSGILSLFTGLLFGVVPAAQASKPALVDALRNMTRGGTAGGARNLLRLSLAAAQIALALMLLIGSGLLIRSFLLLQNASLGCDPHGLLTFGVRFPAARFGKPVGPYRGLVLWEISSVPAATINRIFERLQSLPGVRSAAGSIYPPLIGNFPMTFTIEGRDTGATELNADFFPVTPNFFATMKIPFLRGRDFTDRDTATTPWVAVINETMARRYFAAEDPIGKRIRVDLSPEDQPREIVAVVKDIPASHPQTREEPAIFIPFVQGAPHSTGPYTGLRVQMTFLLRTAGDPMALLPAAARAVAEIDRDRPVVNPRLEDSYIADQTQYPQYYSMLLGLFAAVATGLAAIGIYGVMSYAVEQRTREIGIRMALGAASKDVMKLILGQGLIVIAAGAVVGIAGAMSLTRFLSSQIWEISTTDPRTYTAVTLLLVTIAILACVIPTKRAIRVDVTSALRQE